MVVLIITTVASLAKTKRDPSAIKHVTPPVGEDLREVPVDIDEDGTPTAKPPVNPASRRSR